MARDMPAQRILGKPGELVDRLIRALAAGGNRDIGWLHDSAAWVVVAIGAEHAHTSVSGSRAPVDLVVVGKRLLALLSFGVDEEFLIRSLRDEITDRWRHLATFEGADEARAVGRRELAAALDEPHGLERWRAKHPEDRSAADDDLRESLHHLLQRIGPVDADEAAEYWRSAELWHQLVESYLNDVDIQLWTTLNLRRVNRRP